MAGDVRVALGGELFDGGVKRVHTLPANHSRVGEGSGLGRVLINRDW
jgi:hypothetical protein